MYEWPPTMHEDDDERPASDGDRRSSDRDRFSEAVGDARESAFRWDPFGGDDRT